MPRNYDYNGDPMGEYGAALSQVSRLESEVARLRLTDEEREAIMYFADAKNAFACPCAGALRGLLERLG